jgi:ketosteroid isomerase-like protein
MTTDSTPASTTSGDERRARNEKVFRELLRRNGSSRFAEAGELMTVDVVCEWPYPPIPGLTVKTGRDEIVAMFTGRMGRMEDFRFTVTEVYPLLDPDALIVEYTSDTRRRETGIPYRNDYIAVVRFRDGKVSFWREYLNTLLVAKLIPDEWGVRWED